MGSILCVLSNVMYLVEKFTMFLAAVTTVTCLVVTLLTMLGLGVGLGYNYCFVDIKTKHRYVPGHYRYKVLEATHGPTPPWRRITTFDPKYTIKRDGEPSQPNKRQLDDTYPPASNGTVHNSTESNTEAPSHRTLETTSSGTTAKTILQIQGLDLLALLSKLNSENINYTVQIVTT